PRAAVGVRAAAGEGDGADQVAVDHVKDHAALAVAGGHRSTLLAFGGGGASGASGGKGELAALDLGEAGLAALLLDLAEDGRVERGRRGRGVGAPVAFGYHGLDHGPGV